MRLFINLLMPLVFIPVLFFSEKSVDGQDVEMLRQQARSLLSHPLTMAKAINRGDYYMAEKNFFSSTRKITTATGTEATVGVLVEEQKKIRNVFDFEVKKFVCAVVVERKITDLESLTESRSHEWFVGNADLGNNKLVRFSHNNPMTFSKIKQLSELDVLELIEYPEIRLCWFGLDFGLSSFSKVQHFIDIHTLPDSSSIKVDSGSESLRLEFKTKVGNPDVDLSEVVFRFGKNNMPISYVSRMRMANTKQFVNQHDVKVEWGETKGCFLPTRVTSERALDRFVNDRKWLGVEDTECILQWQSVNEEFEAATFSEENHDSLEKILKLVSPPKLKHEPRK